MTDLLSTNFLRLLTPDVALFWVTAFDGMWRVGIPLLVYVFSWILAAVAFALLIYEMLLTQSFSPLVTRGVRLAILLGALSSYPWLIGGAPVPGGSPPKASSVPSWQLFHEIYRSLYEGKDSFYNRWLINDGKGPMAQAIKDMREGFQRLFAVKVALSAVQSSLKGVLLALDVTCAVGRVASLPFGATGAPLAVGALCAATDMVEKGIRGAEEAASRAASNFTLSLLILTGAHATIIYGTLVIFIATVFTLPLTAAIGMFRGGERALLTAIGLFVGSFLALSVSAVAFAAASATLYRTLGAVIKWSALEGDREIKEELEKAKVVAQSDRKALGEAKRARDQLFRLRRTYYDHYTTFILGGAEVDPSGAKVISRRGVPFTPWGSGEITFGVPSLTRGANGELTYSLTTKTCPGTRVSAGAPLNEGAFNSCFEEMDKAIGELDAAIAKEGSLSALSVETIADKVTSWILRINLQITLGVVASILLAAVLATAMISLVVRVASLVQGFDLGRGVALPR